MGLLPPVRILCPSGPAVGDRRNPKDPLKILIVTSKLLTGFDAPIPQTMYLDKPLRDHALLQAICRTNPPYGEQKSHGLIVDYLGIFDDVGQALKFDEEGVRKAVSNIAELAAVLPAARGDRRRQRGGPHRHRVRAAAGAVAECRARGAARHRDRTPLARGRRRRREPSAHVRQASCATSSATAPTIQSGSSTCGVGYRMPGLGDA